MRRILYLLLTLMAFAACDKTERLQCKDGEKPYRVAVAFTYDSLMECYGEYRHTLEETFRNEGLDVDVHYIYMDISKAIPFRTSETKELVDTALKDKGYDLLITEGNSGLYRLLAETAVVDKHSLPPIIAGGICIPVWEMLRNEPNLKAIWVDEPDFRILCQVAAEMSGCNHVQVELDKGFIEDELRELLQSQIQVPGFIDQVNRTDATYFEAGEDREHPGEIVVSTISLSDPESNAFDSNPELGTGLELTRRELFHAYKRPQVVVKRSMFSNEFSDKSNLPQFTCLPYEFGSQGTRYLAGYFTPMADQAKDMAMTAARILRGENEKVNFLNHHIPQLMMDYNALKSRSINYDTYKDRFHVINVPKHIQNPNQRFVHNFLRLLLTSIIVAIILVAIYIQKRIREERKVLILSHDAIRLISGDAFYFKYNSGDSSYSIQRWDPNAKLWTLEQKPMARLVEVTHPEQRKDIETMKALLTTPGLYVKDMYMCFEWEKEYHHWRMRFCTLKTRQGVSVATGCIFRVDNEYEKKEKVAQMQNQIEEIQKKEKFLNSMNHEIRTPLNSVLGFSQILCNDSEKYSPEERELFCNMIKQGAEQLMGLVQEILDFNRIESGRVEAHLTETLVEDFMLGLFQQWQINMSRKLLDENGIDKSGKIQFVAQEGPRGKMVMLDMAFMTQIYTQLMSNALKNMEEGEIRTGWYVNMKENAVNIYVEDNGEGMDEKSQEMVFHLFWKKNSMERGVGLGLPIVRRMAEMMHGRVYIESRPGCGTRVNIVLPLIKLS